jgi:hypothetical protein
LSYLIAAYVVVLGTLVGYGIRLYAQRRALRRELESRQEPGANP